MVERASDWSGKRVLVTGGSGFKGSWLCAALARLGASVYATVGPQSNPLSGYRIFRLSDEIATFETDITDRSQVFDLLNTCAPDVVFHLAAKSLVPVAIRDPRRTYEVNVLGSLNLLDGCRQLGMAKALVVCSTDHVFGNVEPDALPRDGFPEDYLICGFGGPYDTSKAAMELIVRSYHRTYGDRMPAMAITRCANVFGCGDVNVRRVIPLFVRSAIERRSIPLRYRHNGRQFIHVSDAIAGYILAAGRLMDARNGDDISTYHFANEDYSSASEPFLRMEQLAETVASVFDAEVDDSECLPFAPNENQVQALSCKRTRTGLGWKPTAELRPALRKLGDWYLHQKDGGALRDIVDRNIGNTVEDIVAAQRIDEPVPA